jgi:hypothetical protein
MLPITKNISKFDVTKHCQNEKYCLILISSAEDMFLMVENLHEKITWN